jgi:hypothetical protein
MVNENSFGATGEFPNGKLDESDQGALQFGIAADYENKVVILNFGTPVAWMGIPPDTARLIATSLLRSAGQIDGQVTQVEIGGDRHAG